MHIYTHVNRFVRGTDELFDGESQMDADGLFEYLCQWDEAGYIMCAGTGVCVCVCVRACVCVCMYIYK